MRHYLIACSKCGDLVDDPLRGTDNRRIVVCPDCSIFSGAELEIEVEIEEGVKVA